MRVSQKEKEKTHERIVEAAARLIRERGIEAISVADVMSAVGLTHGGFYRHFPNRVALIAAAIEAAFGKMGSGLEARFENGTPEAALAAYRADYLSDWHASRPGMGCPVAALATDVSRGPDLFKEAFGKGVRRATEAIAQGMEGSQKEREAAAAREFAMLVGAVAIARACDPETARAVLDACRPGQSVSGAANVAERGGEPMP